ncbi:hypothetical protein AB0E15_38455, partial [Streptomyces sp. NPDC047939]
RSKGRQPLADHRTEFEVSYEPGELLAVAYTAQTETDRQAVRTAGPVSRLRAGTDRSVINATAGDLAYVSLTLTDANGICHPAADRPVRLEVAGDGVLAAFGSARPSTDECFDGPEHRTYEGRALAILRPTGPGEIRLIASAPDCEPATVAVTVQDNGHGGAASSAGPVRPASPN